VRNDTGFIAKRAEFSENRCFPIQVFGRRFIRHEWIAHLELSSEQAPKARCEIRIDRVRSFATALN
jgi:CRISPR/Cas system CSM-associated protein Csm3 (group 7 of RAMP superfamily)